MTIPITYTPMTGPLLLWRCLHGGPLSLENVDGPPPDPRMPWEALRARNLLLLEKLTRTYGACAMLAWEGDLAVGMLRFYPKAVATLPVMGGLCLQQAYPAGSSEVLATYEFAPLEAPAYVDLPIIYAFTGQAGARFWERLGYRVVEGGVEPAFQGEPQVELAAFLGTLRREAEEPGIDSEGVTRRYTMRLELGRGEHWTS